MTMAASVAEGGDLPVGIDGVAELGGERDRQRRGVGEGHDGDADGGDAERHEISEADAGQGGRGQSCGEGTDHRDPIRGKAERAHGQRGHDRGGQHAWDPG